jgi:hypothetical protein
MAGNAYPLYLNLSLSLLTSKEISEAHAPLISFP